MSEVSPGAKSGPSKVHRETFIGIEPQPEKTKAWRQGNEQIAQASAKKRGIITSEAV